MASLSKIIGNAQKENKTTPQPKMSNRMSIQMVHYTKLISNEENFYAADKVAELADSICISGKVLQNLVVVPVEAGSYKILAGHKRRLACQMLVEERNLPEFAYLPCAVESVDDVLAEFDLIVTNFTAHDRDDYTKMQEVEKLRSLLPILQPEDDLSGRALRKAIAEKTGLSETKIAQLNSINNNLVEEGKERFRQGTIGTSVATELAGLDEEKQEELLEKENLTVKEVKAAKLDTSEKEILGWYKMTKREQTLFESAVRILFEQTPLSQYMQTFLYLQEQTLDTQEGAKEFMEQVLGVYSVRPVNASDALGNAITLTLHETQVNLKYKGMCLHMSPEMFYNLMRIVYTSEICQYLMLQDEPVNVSESDTEAATDTAELELQVEVAEQEVSGSDIMEDLPYAVNAETFVGFMNLPQASEDAEKTESKISIPRSQYAVPIPEMKNDTQRSEFLETCHDWPVWIEIPEIGEKLYRCDLPDGAFIVYRLWATDYSAWAKKEFDCYQWYLVTDPKETFHFCRSSKTAIMAHLKDMQRGNIHGEI